MSDSLPNSIPIVLPQKWTTVLGLAMSSHMTSDQRVKTVMNKLTRQWWQVHRAMEVTVRIALSFIFPGAWYIFNAPPISNGEANKIQRIGEA